MKAIRMIGLLTFLSLMLPQIAKAQDKADSTGLPGDNFSLQGALELFKNAKNLEDFEKQLNDKSNNVNNLDLNADNKVDYVKVTDKVDNNIHAIVLRINVSAKESQDVAVIAVEKRSDKSAVAQIIGDEELYGKNIVVEPIGNDEQKVASPTGKGPSVPEVRSVFVIVNVWYWPVVQYMYMPDYVVWNSPWYWGYYPSYWSPWSPYPWYYHYDHCRHYHNYHHVVYVNRVNHQPVYRPYRKTSPTVRANYQGARNVRPVDQKSGNRQPVNNMTTRPDARPVQGTQGSRPKREVEQPRQGRPIPVERNVNSQPSRQTNPPVNQQNRPNRQVNPQPRQSPQVNPQRQNPQVNPQPRQSPPMRNSPPPQRSNPPVQRVPQGGRR